MLLDTRSTRRCPTLLSPLSLNASLITWKHLIMTQLWQPTATCSLASNVMQTRWGLRGGRGRGRHCGLNWILCVSASYISSCQIAEIHSCALHDHRFDLCATDMDCLLHWLHSESSLHQVLALFSTNWWLHINNHSNNNNRETSATRRRHFQLHAFSLGRTFSFGVCLWGCLGSFVSSSCALIFFYGFFGALQFECH